MCFAVWLMLGPMQSVIVICTRTGRVASHDYKILPGLGGWADVVLRAMCGGMRQLMLHRQ